MGDQIERRWNEVLHGPDKSYAAEHLREQPNPDDPDQNNDDDADFYPDKSVGSWGETLFWAVIVVGVVGLASWAYLTK